VSVQRSGASVVTETLVGLGVDCVFGLPGTQNVELFEALRRSSRLRTVVATQELAASFMAAGHAMASGRPGVLLTIPGPGFSHALTGLAEAFLDSVPLLHVAGAPATGPGRRFQLQALDQRGMASPVVKRVLDVEGPADIAPGLTEAYALARSGEPGPVLVLIPARLLAEPVSGDAARPPAAGASASPDAAQLDRVAERVARAERVLIYAGQGAAEGAGELRALAEALGAPVVTTTSARGALPEDHPLCRPFDFGTPATDALNAMLERADLVLAVGCKFSHNGAHGFRLRVAPEKLVHVDASPNVPGSNYECALGLCCDAPAFLRALLARVGSAPRRGASWPAADLESFWRRGRARLEDETAEPKIPGADPPTPAGFFAALRRALPAESCLVTDSGLHQTLARRHFTVLSPRGLLIPSNLQSMGFGLPAAIGASLAMPSRPVVALVGDGGLAASGLELLTAVRERVRLAVVVFNDGQLGAIRLQQWGRHGRSHGTALANPDFAKLAAAVGASYVRLERDAEETLREAACAQGVTLVEVVLKDTLKMHSRRAGPLLGRRRRLIPRED
jgi:acetolactate synthase-1/2/3 large subunit